MLMSYAYRALIWLWGFLLTVVVIGPLSSWLYDLIKDRIPRIISGYNPQVIVDLAILHWLAIIVGLLLLGLLTVWVSLKQKVAQRPKLSGPHELPPLPTDFTDRVQEVKDFVRAVRKRGVTTLAVRGMGGVGKTALAVKIAISLAPYFPDGEIYFDLKGVPRIKDLPGVRPRTPGEAMDHVIRAFNRNAPAPPDDDARAGDYRTVLNGKRALLLMDDAHDADQVTPLIPPHGSIIIVTSRQRFDLQGAEAKDLDKLSQADARRLLLAIAPTIGSQADDLASLCDYLPEALRLAAGAIAERPDSFQDILGRMKDAKERLQVTGVALSLNASSLSLSDNLQNLWLELGVFPDTFDYRAAARIWDIESQAARNALSELRRRSLIDWNSAADRYGLTDLVRDYTLSRIDDQTLVAAQARHAEYFRLIVAEADHFCLTGRELEGLELFDREWNNLRAGQAWAAGRAQHDKRAAQLAIMYPYVKTDNLFLRKRPREFLEWLHAARDVAARLHDRHNEGGALHGLGKVYESMSDYDHSIGYYKQYLALEREQKVPILEGGALFDLALVSEKSGRLSDAIEYGKAALNVFQEIGTPYASDVEAKLREWRHEPGSDDVKIPISGIKPTLVFRD